MLSAYFAVFKYLLIFSNEIFPIINATVNFFVYFFIAKKFRAALFNILLCKKEPVAGIVSKTSFRFEVFDSNKVIHYFTCIFRTGEITKVNTNFHNDETRLK